MLLVQLLERATFSISFETACKKFGKYLLLEQIGQGGMGEVYLARTKGARGVGKLFAIKIIQAPYSKDPKMVSRFEREAKLAIQLKHNNIVSIQEFGLEDNQFYVVMDYVEGCILSDLIDELKRLRVLN